MIHRLFVAFCFALMLSACSSSNSDVGLAPGGAPNAAVGGLWDGTAANDLEPGLVARIFGIVSEDGRAQYFQIDVTTGRVDFTDDGVQFSGTIASLENAISGSIRIYAPLGTTFMNGATVVNGTLAGDIVERESIEGIWTAETGDAGDFSQLYDDRYDRDSSLSITQGSWTGTSSIGNTLVLDINADGTISGIDSNGCVYSSAAGNGVSVIDPAFNAYAVNINIDNCGPLNSNNSGLGYIGDSSVTNDLFTISVADGTRAILFEVTK